MSWIFYTLLASNLFAFTNLFDKFSVSKKFKNIYSFAVVINILYFIFNAIIIFYLRNTLVFGWPFFWAAVSGVAFYSMWIFWWKSLTTGEVSRSSAMFFTQPLWNAFLAIIILKESLTSMKWLAIIFIVGGAILSSFERKKNKESFNIAYVYALLAAIVSALGNTIAKYAMGSMPGLTVQAIEYFVTVPLYIILLKNKQVRSEVVKSLTHFKSSILMFLRSALGFGACSSFMLAVSAGPVSLASALSSIQPLLILFYSTLISLFFPKIIKEETSKGAFLTKLIAVVMIITGAMIISLG